MDISIPVTYEGILYRVWIINTCANEVSISVWQRQGEGWVGHSIHHFGNVQYREVGPDVDPTKYEQFPVKSDARFGGVSTGIQERTAIARKVIGEVFDLPEVAPTLSAAIMSNARCYWNDWRLKALFMPTIKAPYRGEIIIEV